MGFGLIKDHRLKIIQLPKLEEMELTNAILRYCE